VQYVTVEVKGKEDKYKGPYSGRTDKDGRYNILIGPLNDDLDDVEFEAKVVGAGVESEDSPDWIVSSDCDQDDANQIYEINWVRKN
jgi:hypothetical protein